MEFLDFTTFVNNVQRSAIKLPVSATFCRTSQAKRFRPTLIIEPRGSRQEGAMTSFPTTCCGELGSFDAGNLEQMTSSAGETVGFDNE